PARRNVFRRVHGKSRGGPSRRRGRPHLPGRARTPRPPHCKRRKGALTMSTLATSEPALTFLIACCAKAPILLACAWITVITLRQRSSALRHHVWAAAILASLALPFFATVNSF